MNGLIMIEIHVYKHFAADTLLSGPFLIPEKWTENPRLIVVLVASSGSLLLPSRSVQNEMLPL
jgi:hypothetical protein